jgi:hypothetical protein
MNPEKLEKFISDARRNGTPDISIREQLIVGGWKAEQVDEALKKTFYTEQRAVSRAVEDVTIHQPPLITGFLTSFIILLIAYNLVTYSGVLLGIPDSPPVSNVELVAGLLFSFVAAIVIGLIYSGIKKTLKR